MLLSTEKASSCWSAAVERELKRMQRYPQSILNPQNRKSSRKQLFDYFLIQDIGVEFFPGLASLELVCISHNLPYCCNFCLFFVKLD